MGFNSKEAGMQTKGWLGLRHLCFLIFLAGAISGCGTRSISNSSYYADSDRGHGHRNSPFYKGELNEFDVLGIDAKSPIAEADIRDSWAQKLGSPFPKAPRSC